MSTRLSRYFEKRRRALGLKPGQLAILAGCPNPIKAGNVIRTFELTGKISQELFEKLIAVLEIDLGKVDQLVERDRRDYFDRWFQWVNEPIEPYVVQRLMPAVYRRLPLPEGIESLEEAEEWVSGCAREFRTKCCLVWSRRLSVWFDEKGNLETKTEAEPGKSNAPWVRAGGEPVHFSENLRSLRPVYPR